MHILLLHFYTRGGKVDDFHVLDVHVRAGNAVRVEHLLEEGVDGLTPLSVLTC